MTEAITLTRYISLIQGQQILVFSGFVRTVSFVFDESVLSIIGLIKYNKSIVRLFVGA